MKKWSTKDQLTDLLCDLVLNPSVTGSEAEKRFPYYVAELIGTLPYFHRHPEHLQVFPTGDGRSFVTGLVKGKTESRDTVVLLSHFDVVEVEDYGDWRPYAFDVRKLTSMFLAQKENLPQEIRRDLENGDWIFGRGVMDMKCGLALHMSMLERAAEGEFEGNVLLLTVPDEEVNSVGMRAAVPVLNQLADRHGLDYKLVLNSEPMSLQHFDYGTFNLEKGSMGKVLPGFLCYGKETHVMEPMSGLNGNYMASEITCEMELDSSFIEHVAEDVSPPPTNLIQYGLKKNYSVQTPYRAVTMFNLFLLDKTADEVMEPLLDAAGRAARRIELNYRELGKFARSQDETKALDLHIRVMSYEELHEYAVRTYGADKVDQTVAEVLRECEGADEREASARVVDAMAMLCKELAPMIVLFFAPPYYPSVNSRRDPLIAKLTDKLSDYGRNRHGVVLHQRNFHAAMTDLSYVGSKEVSQSQRTLAGNMPLWENGYSIPFRDMERFRVPVMNFGPFGFDLHKWTERLNRDYSFGPLPDMLALCIRTVFSIAGGEEISETGKSEVVP